MLYWILACAPAETTATPLTCGEGTERVSTGTSDECVPVIAGTDSAGETGDSGVGDSAVVSELEVYLLAGQSNMDGYAYQSGLAPSSLIPDPRVPMYWSGWGQFRDLQPGSYGGNFYTGPEVTFGRTLADAGRHVALVKHAVGGTDLATYWNPGVESGDDAVGEGWRGLMQSMKRAEAELDASGKPWHYAGFVWMQGESDATVLDWANTYEANLVHLLDRVREESEEPELPAYIGLISTEEYWTYSTKIRDAEASVASADPYAYLIETDDLPRNPFDLAHYDGTSNRVLGQRFAESVLAVADISAGGAPGAAMRVETYSLDYDFTGTCGWSFTLTEAIAVTDVGGFGPSDYLYTSSDLGIWDDQGDLVFRATVPSWTETPSTFRDGFWYVAVEPTVLEPGEYRVGYVSWTGDYDHYGNNAIGEMGDGFIFGEGVYVDSYWLAYPSNGAGGASLNFVGPNILYTPVAE